jgi:alkylation response protein AidB-like acyl-CoA dehydrogenase
MRHSPLLTEEARELAETVRRFACDRLDDTSLASRDAAGEFWHEGWRRCAAMGLCGLPVPTELGGGGADRVTTAAALEALGYGCADGGLMFSLSAHLWSAVVPLWQFGDDRQQKAYLGPLCRGEMIGLHAMTEPESGSDAFALSTTARRAGEGYVLQGRKVLITNAPIADVLVVFARSPGSTGPLGVSAFLVEAGAPGLAVSRSTEKLGLRTSPMAEVVLDGVPVGSRALLGRAGHGAKVFACSMEWERTLIMATQLGALERSLEESIAYARSRHQFGAPIGSFQAVADKLVDTKVALDASRALLYETAWRLDHGDGDAAQAAAVKLMAAETVVRGALDLLQVHGGHAYTAELPLERRLRDALGARLYSGTSEVMRRIVAKAMGL